MKRISFIKFLKACTVLISLTASNTAFASFDGFGKDIPLESAAKQIVPSGWMVDYGDNVDTTTPISWGAANDWQSALSNAVSKAGLNAQFGSNSVIIAKRSAAVGDRSHSASASPAPKPRKPAPVRSEAKPSPAPKQASHVTAPHVEGGGGGFTMRPYRGASEASSSTGGLATKGEDGFTPYSAPAATFSVAAGQMLRPVLAEWAMTAGWRLIWESEYDYRIEADASFGSDFVQSVSSLATAMTTARPAITVDFFNGNNVVVVSNKAADAVN